MKSCFFGFLLFFWSNAACLGQASAQPLGIDLLQREGRYVIDLPTAMRLANAQNLDVQIAREKMKEAIALQENAKFKFFPTFSPGIGYRRHDNLIQAVDGQIISVHKQSYAPGLTIGGQWDFGETIYQSLAAKQQAKSAEHRLESQRQDSVLLAILNYFDLQFSHAAIQVAQESLRISTNYETQLSQAVAAGLAFKGDQLRVQVQSERSSATLRRAREQERIAAARLAQSLHLDSAIELVTHDTDFAPLLLVETNTTLASLVQETLANRSEMKEAKANYAAALESEKGAVYGPLIPSLGAQVFTGGLAGDSDAGPARFGAQEDYAVGLSWKIGPGGIFDSSRKKAAAARLQAAQLADAKVRDEVAVQVVESFTRIQSLQDQIESARRALHSAENGLALAQQRREFSVGIVLENILAEQDLTRARFDYLKAVAEFNKTQYALKRATGKL
ncbi:MAG TPA: TolC family protein [Verrucomicrobiae bacterium]|nr:TolC family protein [Verrucomicrobiae bacterium]